VSVFCPFIRVHHSAPPNVNRLVMYATSRVDDVTVHSGRNGHYVGIGHFKPVARKSPARARGGAAILQKMASKMGRCTCHGTRPGGGHLPKPTSKQSLVIKPICPLLENRTKGMLFRVSTRCTLDAAIGAYAKTSHPFRREFSDRDTCRL
jgi:hypothetical protein